MRVLNTIVCTGLLGLSVTCGIAPALAQTSAQARITSPSQVSVPLSDARNIEPNSVRFSAAQFTNDSPTVVLFGMNRRSWPKIRAAIQQAVFEGYPVSGVFMGPTSEAPALEIYAKGHHVTNPINPDQISQADLTKLLRDVSREYYRR